MQMIGQHPKQKAIEVVNAQKQNITISRPISTHILQQYPHLSTLAKPQVILTQYQCIFPTDFSTLKYLQVQNRHGQVFPIAQSGTVLTGSPNHTFSLQSQVTQKYQNPNLTTQPQKKLTCGLRELEAKGKSISDVGNNTKIIYNNQDQDLFLTKQDSSVNNCNRFLSISNKFNNNFSTNICFQNSHLTLPGEQIQNGHDNILDRTITDLDQEFSNFEGQDSDMSLQDFQTNNQEELTIEKFHLVVPLQNNNIINDKSKDFGKKSFLPCNKHENNSNNQSSSTSSNLKHSSSRFAPQIYIQNEEQKQLQSDMENQLLHIDQEVVKKKLSSRKQKEFDTTMEYISLIQQQIKTRYSDMATNFKSAPKRIMKQDLQLKHSERSDVLFKTITREIRKVYLKIFAKETKYLRVQRYRENYYYLTSLINFVRNQQFLNQTTQEAVPIDQGDSSLRQLSGSSLTPRESEVELIFFFGSLFYPKRFKNIFPDKSLHGIIDIITACLYQFTISRFDFVNEWPAFKLIFNHFKTNHLFKSLEQNKAMKRTREDYVEGFKYLAKKHQVPYEDLQ